MKRSHGIRLVIYVIAALAIAFVINRDLAWRSASFSLEETPAERVVDERFMRSGRTLSFRLEPKAGAAATLVIEGPERVEALYSRSFEEGRLEGEYETRAHGTHKILLLTPSAGTDPGITPPEVEVNWRYH